MSKGTIFLIGNWKMNLSPSAGALFARSLRERLPPLARTEVWVTPPAISAAHVAHELGSSPISIGTQDVHWETSGAFTGETSAAFAADLGLTFSLLGHSERRTLFGETSERVALRMRTALYHNLTPVVCIGETEAERSSCRTEQVLQAQLRPIFEQLTQETSSRVIIAYEPVWAIGTGTVASEAEIQATHAHIHELWNAAFKNSSCRIVYGGSVNPANFPGIIALPGVAGALVGGASIKLDQWLELISIAEGLRGSSTYGAALRATQLASGPKT
jgi:triosephosphate isomerase